MFKKVPIFELLIMILEDFNVKIEFLRDGIIVWASLSPSLVNVVKIPPIFELLVVDLQDFPAKSEGKTKKSSHGRNWNIVYILIIGYQNNAPPPYPPLLSIHRIYSVKEMLRSPSRITHSIPMESSEQIWPDDTIVVLPETPRVRLSPRRKMNLYDTPGWPPAHITETIRMYHDSDDEEEKHIPQFTMNPEFIESNRTQKMVTDEDMQTFMPPVSPSKVRALSPSKRDNEMEMGLQDDVIEIPDSAGLSDETRMAIFNVWADEDIDDSGFVDGLHYTRVSTYLPSSQLTTGLSKRTI